MRLKPISFEELLAADDENGDVDADLAAMEEQAIAAGSAAQAYKF